MARPAKRFTPDVGRGIVIVLSGRLYDHKFCQKNLIKIPNEGIANTFQARKALEPLYAVAGRRSLVPFEEKHCAQLTEWLNTYMTQDGWVRFLAAERKSRSQRHKTYEKGTHQIGVNAFTQLKLLKMAKEVELNRKEYLNLLTSWLSFETDGNAAHASFMKFIAKAKAEQKGA